MERRKSYPPFVTERRIEQAVRHADALAFDDPSLTAYDCAAAAVQESLDAG